MKESKTNAMRILDRTKIEYEVILYDLGDVEFSGEAVSKLTGIPPERNFKTLTAKTDGGYLVFLVPVNAELDMKKAARAAGKKRVEMLPLKDLLSVTGYNRGEVSPLGMKKKYPVYIDESALEHSVMTLSAGKKGVSITLAPRNLAEAVEAQFADLRANH